MVTSCAVMVFGGACATFPAHGSLSMFSTLHSVFNPAFVSVPYQFLCYVLVLASRQGVSFLQLRDRHSGSDRSDRFTCKQLIKHVTATFRWQLWWRLQTIDNGKKKKRETKFFPVWKRNRPTGSDEDRVFQINIRIQPLKEKQTIVRSNGSIITSEMNRYKHWIKDETLSGHISLQHSGVSSGEEWRQ